MDPLKLKSSMKALWARPLDEVMELTKERFVEHVCSARDSVN